MDLYIAFGVFIGAMLATLATGHSMIIGLLIGLVAFLTVGKRKGFSLKSMGDMSKDSVKDSLTVILIMLIIGVVTASWRVSGTITVFVYYGMKVIMPPLFLIITFLLCCFLSYAIGTSFGVVGTVGVIFMALARSGGVNPVITAGVIMSGIYFGDRGSPVSSSANLVAALTKTDTFENVKLMFRTGALPLAITAVTYSVLSVLNPISHVDPAMIKSFEEEFIISPWSFLPAVLVIALPLLKMKVLHAMAVSITSAIFVACLVQGVPLLEVLKICIVGYEAPSEGIGAILNGGGLVSMLEVGIILIISGTYSGIFGGTGMLLSMQDKLSKACSKMGRFGVMVCMSVAMSIIFCNQTIGTLMCNDLLKEPYLKGGGTNRELAIDMENSIIVIAGLIPWCIACSVPMALMNVNFTILPFAVYLYAVPICYIFTKKKWFDN